MEASPKVGLEALLTPDNCVLVLIDHQPFQLANVNSQGTLSWIHERARSSSQSTYSRRSANNQAPSFFMNVSR